MKNFKELRQKTQREQYIAKKVFREGDYIMHVLTGEKGKIHRAGVNYVIAITEQGDMFRAWIKDIRDINITRNS